MNTPDKRVEEKVNKFYQEFGVSAEIIDPKAENKFTGKYIRRWNRKPDIKTVARWWGKETQSTLTQYHQDLLQEDIERLELMKIPMLSVKGKPFEIAEAVGSNMTLDEIIAYKKSQYDIRK